MRKFEAKPAARERVPVLVGLVGPSGGGKTFSALRLATGMQRVTGGKIYYVDTEARRALHYADLFEFQHVQFDAPFSPDDYLAALRFCVEQGATTIVVDSMSHEHEGPGGVLEMQQAEHQRLGGGDNTKFLSWVKPKQARRRLINSILQMGCNFIFCFRAKDRIKPPKKGEKEVQQLGWQPIAADEFVYEMTVNCLLPPGANGVPTWQPEFEAERRMTKLPEFAKEWFAQRKPLDEALGEELARWAEGAAAPTLDEVLAEYGEVKTKTAYRAAQKKARSIWGGLDEDAREKVQAAMDAAKARIAGEAA